MTFSLDRLTKRDLDNFLKVYKDSIFEINPELSLEF